GERAAPGEVLELQPGTIPLLGDGQAGAIAIRPVHPDLSVPGWLASQWHVVSDEDYALLASVAPAARRSLLVVYDWAAADETRALNTAISRLVPPDTGYLVADRFGTLVQTRQILSLSMFIGLFISLLFFIGAGSMIYFK